MERETIKYYTTGAYKRKLTKRKKPKDFKLLILLEIAKEQIA